MGIKIETPGGGGGGTTSPAGSNTNVQFNDNGSFGGDNGFVYSGTNVGIGIATPRASLDFGTTTGNKIILTYIDGTRDYKIGVANVAMEFNTDRDFRFNEDGVTKVIINSGNVGIATTAPNSQLDVAGTITSITLNVTSLDTGLVKSTSGTGLLSTASSSSDYQVFIPTGTTSQFYRGDKSWQLVPDTGAGAGVIYAPTGATYIVQIPSATLTNEQAIADLSTGILKGTSGTGLVSIAVAGTDFESVVATGTTAQFYRGDKTFALVPDTGTGAGISWTEYTGTALTMTVDNGYIANNGSLITFTVPATIAIGKIFRVVGAGAGGWKIAQQAGQQIKFGLVTTTSGATGYIQSSNQYDTTELVCIATNTNLIVASSVGNITYAQEIIWL